MYVDEKYIKETISEDSLKSDESSDLTAKVYYKEVKLTIWERICKDSEGRKQGHYKKVKNGVTLEEGKYHDA